MIKLEKQEYICPECNGIGNHIVKFENCRWRYIMVCRICNGDKKIGWIQNIIREKRELYTILSVYNNGDEEVYIQEIHLYLKPGFNSLNRTDADILLGMFLINNEKLSDYNLDIIEYKID